MLLYGKREQFKYKIKNAFYPENRAFRQKEVEYEKRFKYNNT
jgi:hypothetical protein